MPSSADDRPNAGCRQAQEVPAECVCKICGDRAGCGINFGCLSCESCKAFFRRCCAKPNGQQQVCPFAGQCQITVASRRACPACRLQKCVREGMRRDCVDAWKKHWTGRNNEKLRKGGKPKVDEPRVAKQNGQIGRSGCKCTCSCGALSVGTSRSEKATQTEEMPVINSTALNPSEQSLLEELLNANAILDTPLRVPHPLLPLKPTLLDALAISELAMRRMVGMCKQLAPFRGLRPNDQLQLLRGALIQLLILRGAMAFDPGQEAWRHAVLNAAGGQPLPFSLHLDVLPPKERHSEEHKRFLLTFGEQWRTNKKVMLILHAIVLFSPRQTEPLEDGKAVEQCRSQYCSFLKRCLLLESHACEETAFAHLMVKLEELRCLNASLQWLYNRIGLAAHLGEPLIRELLADR